MKPNKKLSTNESDKGEQLIALLNLEQCSCISAVELIYHESIKHFTVFKFSTYSKLKMRAAAPESIIILS